MRLFVAAYPPPAVRDHLAELVPALMVGRPAAPGRSLRLASPEHWHLTLAFLGDVADESAGTVAEALALAARDASPASVRLAGGGRFGTGRFTVLWAGMGGDLETLDATAKAVRRRLKGAKVSFDRKPFRPHLTLARPGDRLTRDEVDRDVRVLREYQGPEWLVDEVCLVRSRLGPRPEYQRLGTWRLTPR